jgi:hypothetical protein
VDAPDELDELRMLNAKIESHPFNIPYGPVENV